MTSLLIRLILLIVLLWLLQRFLSRLFGGSKQADAGTPREPQAISTSNMVKDPVCGMYMDARLAVRLEGRKELYYFCSDECKNKYLGKPGKETGMHNAPPA